MSYEIIIKYSKKIESELKDIGAEGKGLHELITSIEDQIPYEIVKMMRYIASVRNNLIHNDDYDLTNDILSNYSEACKKVIEFFQQQAVKEVDTKPKKGGLGWLVLSAVAVIGGVAAMFLKKEKEPKKWWEEL